MNVIRYRHLLHLVAADVHQRLHRLADHQWGGRQDKGVVEALTKAHRAAAGQRMAGGHHNPHIHLGKRPDLQFTRGLGIEHDAEIRLAGDQRLLDVDIVDGGQCKRDVGIMFMHLFEHRRKEMPVNGIDGSDAHMPPPQPAQVIQLLADPGKVLFPVIGRVQEQLPGGGQPQPGGMALEERHRQLLFHAQNLTVDGRRRHMQRL